MHMKGKTILFNLPKHNIHIHILRYVFRILPDIKIRIHIVCADSVTRGLVRDHPSMNMKIGTLVPGYVLSANLSL